MIRGSTIRVSQFLKVLGSLPHGPQANLRANFAPGSIFHTEYEEGAVSPGQHGGIGERRDALADLLGIGIADLKLEPSSLSLLVQQPIQKSAWILNSDCTEPHQPLYPPYIRDACAYASGAIGSSSESAFRSEACWLHKSVDALS
jgi:hypothetical protein